MDKLDSNKKQNILLKLYKQNGEITKYSQKGYTRRISQIISHANFEKAYIKVSYGIKENVLGKKEMFYNDGWYDNKQDLLEALTAFREED